MIALINSKKAQILLAENIKNLRLEKGFTQQGLSKRAGVSLATLRKFEQKGEISISSFLKLAITLDCIEKLIKATEPEKKEFTSIDDVINRNTAKKRKRGWRE